MYIYRCDRCGYEFETEKHRDVPFRSPHEDRRNVQEGMSPPRCNALFQRIWTPPNLSGLETR